MERELNHKTSFTLKVVMWIVILLMSMFIFGSTLYYLESETQPDLYGSIWDGVWIFVLSIITVGYGSPAPVTIGGKIVYIFATVIIASAGLACLLWIVVRGSELRSIFPIQENVLDKNGESRINCNQ